LTSGERTLRERIMGTTRRTLRIFFSSTFSDLVAERNALREHLFPRLHAQDGERFQTIDMRWV